MWKNKLSKLLQDNSFYPLLLGVLVIIILFSCRYDEEHSIAVRGKIELNSKEQHIILKIFKVFEDRQEAIDSVNLSNDHRNYSFHVDREGIYSLGVSSDGIEKTYMILQKGKPVEINFDLKKKKVKFMNSSAGQVHKELFQLIEQDNKQFYKYIKLSLEERAASGLEEEFKKKQKAALKNIHIESDPLLKQLSVFKYVNYTYFLGTMNYYDDQGSLDTHKLIVAKKIFDIIPPESFFWSYNSQSPLLLLSDYKFPFTLLGFSNSLKNKREMLDQVIIKQKDAGVSGYTAIFTLYSFTVSDDKEEVKKYLNLYFKRDTAEYSKEIKLMFNEFFSPGRKIRTGAQLPQFSIPSLKDSTVIYTNSTFNKGAYLIDFWATWCKPCMKEIPLHQKAYQKYHDSKQFDILSISFDRSPEIVEKFRASHWKMSWKHAILPAGKNDPLAKRMSVSYLPQMILVDGKTNTVIAELIRLKEGNLEKVLREYYKE